MLFIYADGRSPGPPGPEGVPLQWCNGAAPSEESRVPATDWMMGAATEACHARGRWSGFGRELLWGE
ncbi:hypothetical protein GCM10010274_00390 [Streptomyces lavendofoliae]|uniref:Uncharacterized protein n=1 Tax=Streptomyces lavendofoliae TaxID=67314 RepID=A0A918M170_9ACTN|nr:hypothetical protein GCM10010274_00390 [Streptomyces lavendofoliae]